MTNRIDVNVSTLDAELDGDAVGPGDAAWDDARSAWNLAFDQQPAAVARVRTAEDVQRTVRFAAANGLRVAPQGTGHGAGAAGRIDDAILLRTQALGGVDVDPATRLARVGAGVQWRDLAAVASPLGLAGLAGTSGTVGVAGYTLGGGAGWLVRRHGLGAWSLRAADVVTADGERVRVTDTEHADLLWALRGLRARARRRHRARAGARRAPHRARRRPLVADRGGAGGVPHLVAARRRAVRRRDVDRAPAAPAAAAGAAGAPARQGVRDRRGRQRRRCGAARGHAADAARARPGHGHRRGAADRPPGDDPRRPRGPGRRRRRGPPADGAAAGRARRRARRWPARTRRRR